MSQNARGPTRKIASAARGTFAAAGRYRARTAATMASAWFLRPSFASSTTAGSARTFVDVAVSETAACPARPFTAFGVWNVTVQ